MGINRVVTTEKMGLTMAQVGGNDIYRMLPQVTSIVQLGGFDDDYVHLFAEPVDGGNSIDWYVDDDAEAICVLNLPDNERQEALTRFRNMRNNLQDYIVNQLRAEGKNRSYRNYADILEKALIIPNLGYLYMVAGRLVLVGWGFLENETQLAEYGKILSKQIEIAMTAPAMSGGVSVKDKTTRVSRKKKIEAEEDKTVSSDAVSVAVETIKTDDELTSSPSNRADESVENSQDQIEAIEKPVEEHISELEETGEASSQEEGDKFGVNLGMNFNRTGKTSDTSDKTDNSRNEAESKETEQAAVDAPDNGKKNHKKWLLILLALLVLGLLLWLLLREDPLAFLKGDTYIRGVLANEAEDVVDLKLHFPGTDGKGTIYFVEPDQTCSADAVATLDQDGSVLFNFSEAICPNQNHYQPFTMRCIRTQGICRGKFREGQTWTVNAKIGGDQK